MTTHPAGRATLLRSAAFAIALSSLVWSGTASAGDSDTERARALFDEAGALERHGQWGAAEERLRAALRLRDTAQLHYALAWALENDDKLLEAKTEYESALRIGKGQGPSADEVTRLATARLVDLEKKMPLIRIRVSGPARTATRVTVDGREVRLEEDGGVTAVNPGSHVVHAARGADGVDQMVYVGRGTVRTVDFDGGVLAGPRPGAMRTSAPTRHASRVGTPARGGDSSPGSNLLPWLLIAGGFVGVVGGAGLLISSGTDADERDAMSSRWCAATRCASAQPTLPESAEARQYRLAADEAGDASGAKQMAGLLLGTAGAITAGIGALLLFQSGSDERSRTRTALVPSTSGGIASASFVF